MPLGDLRGTHVSVFLQAGRSPKRPDCLPGVVGLELRNVAANYPLERPHKFGGIQPNSVDGDYSRLSRAAGEMPLGPSAAGIFSKHYAPMLVAPQEHSGREPRCSPVTGFYFNPRGTRNLSFSGHQKQRKICCRSNPSTSAPVVLSGAAFLSRDRAPIRLRRDARGGHEGIREELAATFIKRRKSSPHLFHLPGGRRSGASESARRLYLPTCAP
jgi:hypothetical protein